MRSISDFAIITSQSPTKMPQRDIPTWRASRARSERKARQQRRRPQASSVTMRKVLVVNGETGAPLSQGRNSGEAMKKRRHHEAPSCETRNFSGCDNVIEQSARRQRARHRHRRREENRSATSQTRCGAAIDERDRGRDIGTGRQQASARFAHRTRDRARAAQRASTTKYFAHSAPPSATPSSTQHSIRPDCSARGKTNPASAQNGNWITS